MTSIFVAKLDFGFSSEQLRDLFAQHGKVLKANVATDRETGKSRGFAFVEMADRNEAMNAISALDGHLVNGRPIAVKEAEQRENRTPNPRTSGGDFNQKPREPRTEGGYSAPRDVNAILPTLDIPLNEPKKKVNKEKDKKSLDSDSRSKKPKMDAFKKSGKEKKFFDDDDDLDDLDLFSYKRKDEEDFDDEEDED
jgi:RNA recognition motif-containing protein